MPESFQTYAPYILIAIALIAVAIWLFIRMNRKTTIIKDDDSPVSKDVLDEGAAPASRNQALIDAPAAATVPNPNASSNMEPVVEPAPVESTHVPSTAPANAPPATEYTSENTVSQLKGVGPRLVTMLAEQGITSLEQVAKWDENDIARVDATLGRFQGRISRDQWVEQAKLLISGDKSAYSAKFGNNG